MGHLNRTCGLLFKSVCGLLLCSALLPAAWAAHPRTFDLYMPEAPPLSMTGDAGQQGIVADAARQAMTLAGYHMNINVLPWLRAQRTVQHGQDMLIVPLSRTPDRETSYTWIAPIMSMDRAFFTLDKRVDSFAQARRTYRRIAVGMGSAQERRLYDEGFDASQIYPLRIGENPAQMLLLGRVDAWFNGVPESQYIWRQVSKQPLLMSPVLMTTDLYLACSKTCSPRVVSSLRKAVETLHRNGSIQRLLDHYLPAAP
ncbi:substrate-binding periplasmic protein [Pseudomonas sp. CFBP 13602]|uniref:substrate-binding periplasmic protein n=1 Tax=Pseudomonas sp. CFBP 13602 TaxID=2774039 RepID=UPI001783FC2B|nr:transporter substrate-binding domain-containing protein [Pseudomonas sp. CFBP 13602]MBD8828042.1 transporter substrate-binding domain-containing protein [Pseudomonas sp. CFBP 13602]